MTGINVFSFFIIGLFAVMNTYAQDTSFVYTCNSQGNYIPSYIGNGYFSLSSTPMGSDPAESYMAGVYDEAPKDISRIALLPEWNEINVKTRNKWLNDTINKVKPENYFQKIDMYSGILTTSYSISTSGKSSEIKTTSFISRANKNIAVIRFDVKPHYSGNIEIRFPLKERKTPVRMPLAELKNVPGWADEIWPPVWYGGFIKLSSVNTLTKDKIISCKGSSEGRNTKIFIALKIDWEGVPADANFNYIKLSNGAEYSLLFNTESGKTYTFYKYVYVGKTDNNKEINFAIKTLSKFTSSSFDVLMKSNDEACHHLWDTDIILEGNPYLQKIIHTMEYYLFTSCNEDAGFSIPPMGLSTSGYYGHIFWDSDTWILPSLLMMHPEFAKNIVQYRYKFLDAAIKNALKNGHKGAMYPWEGDDLGKEAIPIFAIECATNEIHVTGDVALGQWQYFLATGDTAWLRDFGWKVIEKTAEFWENRVAFNREKDRYEIKNVVSVDEGQTGINNDSFTNAIAKTNLRIAITASEILKKPRNSKWETIEKNIYIPYDSLKKYNPTYENASIDKQGLVPLLLEYPLSYHQEKDILKNNLGCSIDHLMKNGNGVMMTVTFLPIIASELDDRALFDKMVNLSFTKNLRPPYNAITETPENRSYNFLTGAGGFLQQIIFGYTGLRITDEGLVQKFAPMLPEGVNKLTLKNFHYGDKSYDFVVQNGKLEKIPK